MLSFQYEFSLWQPMDSRHILKAFLNQTLPNEFYLIEEETYPIPEPCAPT